MFDIGFQELLIIFVIALLVFGPDKLPEVGRTLGRWLIEIRRGIHNAKVQMEAEFDETEKKRAEQEAVNPDETGKIDNETAEETKKDGKENG